MLYSAVSDWCADRRWLLVIALALPLVAGCGPSAPFPAMPSEARSDSVAVPAELQVAYDALRSGGDNAYHSDADLLAMPLAERRARVYWSFSEEYAAGSALDFHRSDISVRSAALDEQQLLAAASAVAAAHGLTHSLRPQARNFVPRLFVFRYHRALRRGELAWLADQILLARPDAFLTVGPDWIAPTAG